MRRPGDWSVRARTTLAGIAVLTPVLAAAAITGVLVQGHELTRATATVAQEQARLLVRQIAADGAPVGGLPNGDDGLVQVVGPDGVLDASPSLLHRPPLTPRPRVGGTVEREVRDLVAGEEDTYLAVSLRVGDTTTYVVSVRSLENVDAATSSTTRLLVIGVPAVLALVAALTWLLAGRALAPVERLRRRASEISVAGTGVRLPAGSSGDEIGRLADTLNEMLGRLDASARSQRQFVADASHELRSPVAAIRTVMEVSATAPSDPDEVRTDVLVETRRLEVLVDGLLALARRDATDGSPAPRRARVDLTGLVADAAQRPRRTVVDPTLDEGVTVSGDAHALALMLGCLLDNADRHARTHVDVRLAHDATAVTLTVTDDGDGVAPEQRERIFDRFVRLDEARTRDAGGAGLGLAIARAIAEEHRGTLRCVTRKDGATGATFVLSLPAAD